MAELVTARTSATAGTPAPRSVVDIVLPPPNSQQERFEVVAGAADPKQLANVFRLQVDSNHKAKSTLSNVIEAAANSDIWRGHVWYDEFLDRVLIRDGKVREWNDADAARGAAFLQRNLLMDKITPSTMHTGMVTYAVRDARKHCVRDWLETLEWDKVDRLPTAFEDYWGVTTGAQMPADYVRAASTNFLVSMVARIYRPGCQVDTMPVFEGKQGRGKSSALRILGGEYYAQQSDSVSSKDFFQTLAGKWLLEIGELDAFSRAEVTRVKTVVSTPVDRYRPSYGRTATDHPRQCVFAGTTNKDDWGNDETGLRRFWPIRCGEIDLKKLEAIRDQLFAEAVARFKLGATWWEMPTENTANVQDARQHEEAWTGPIMRAIQFDAEVTVADILVRILKVEMGSITRTHTLTVVKILRANGWTNEVTWRDGKAHRAWMNPAQDVAI